MLGSPQARRIFEQTLERVRRWCDPGVFGYVVMPEHVHLLVSEPEHSSLAVANPDAKADRGAEVVSHPVAKDGRQGWGTPGLRFDLDSRIL